MKVIVLVDRRKYKSGFTTPKLKSSQIPFARFLDQCPDPKTHFPVFAGYVFPQETFQTIFLKYGSSDPMPDGGNSAW